MDAISFVAERKIEKALEEGLFDNLPGMGEPLSLEDLSPLPPDVRMAYTILKNSGHIEKAPEAGSIVTTRDLLTHCPDEAGTYGKMRRLKVMLGRVRRARGEAAASDPADSAGSESVVDDIYLQKLITRM
jgi:hypothetical protein